MIYKQKEIHIHISVRFFSGFSKKKIAFCYFFIWPVQPLIAIGFILAQYEAVELKICADIQLLTWVVYIVQWCISLGQFQI